MSMEYCNIKEVFLSLGDKLSESFLSQKVEDLLINIKFEHNK